VEDIHIVAFAGSLRRASYNRGLVRAASEVAPEGVSIEILDLGAIPLFNQDIEDAGEPAPILDFKHAIAEADALLVATPEYNHGVPGVLKNALDWASRPRETSPLKDKAVGVFGASPGRGSTARAQAQLRETFVFTGACVMPQPELLVSSAAHLFDHDGNVVDAALRESIRGLVGALRDWTFRIQMPRAA
jgi:chromate reductase